MSNHRHVGFVGLVLLVLLTAGAVNAPKRTVFSDLKVGQQVGLKDHGVAYQISVLDDTTPQSHKVVEIGEDFIVLEDVTGVTRTTIPVTSVKSIVRLRTP